MPNPSQGYMPEDQHDYDQPEYEFSCAECRRTFVSETKNRLLCPSCKRITAADTNECPECGRVGCETNH